jgi:serine/threonine protein kinase
MVDRVGKQLGNYHLIRFLGLGGFAEVYLGEHVYLGTKAAIKILHTQLAKDDLEGFRKEGQRFRICWARILSAQSADCPFHPSIGISLVISFVQAKLILQ